MAKNKIKGLTVEVDGDILPFKKALRQVNAEVKDSNASLKNLDSALKLDPKNTEILASKQQVLSKAIQDNEKALKKFTKIQDQLKSKGIDETSKDYTELQKKIVEAEKSIKKYSAELQKIPYAATIRGSEELAKSFEQVYQATKRISQLSVAGLFGLGFNAAQYETDVANIKKIVRDLKDETVNDLKEIAVATSSSFTDIAGYATIAAALGVAQEDLSEFARTMKDLETVTDGSIIGEEGAKMVARFLNVMNIGTDEVHNFGSALTIVEDKLAVTADEVLEVASRLGALSAIGNVTQHDIIGLGGTMMNLGLRVESSASAITRVFLDIENQVATTSDKMTEYAKVAGMTAEEFSSMWDSKPMEAFIRFTDGLKSSVFLEMGEAVRENNEALNGFASTLGMTNEEFEELYNQNPQKTFNAYIDALTNLEDTGESTSVILDELGLSGVRTAETLLKLAGNGEQVREMIETSNEAWSKNTDLTEKASVVYETTEKQLQATWEAIKQAAESIGKNLLPVVKDGADFIKELAKSFEQLPDSVKRNIVNLLMFGSAIAPIAKIGSKTSKMVGDITKGIASIGQESDKSASLLTKFVKGLGGIVKTNPGLLVAAGAIGAVGVAVAAYTSNQSESIKATNALSDATEHYKDVMEEAVDVARDSYNQKGMDIARGEIAIEQIEDLVSKIDEANAVGGDTSSMTQQIYNGIDSINGILGEQAYYYDEANNKIIDMNGNVLNLRDSWAENAKEIQRTAFIEAYTQAYYEAIEANKELQDKQLSTAESFRREFEQVDDYYKNLFDKWQNADEMGKQSLQLQIGDDQIFQGLVEKYNEALGAINQSTEEQLKNNSLINLMENGLTMDTDTFLEQAKIWSEGLAVPQETLSSLDQYDDKIDEITAKIQSVKDAQAMGGLIQNDVLTKFEEELAILQQERAILEQEIAKLVEMANQQAKDSATTTMDTIGQTFIDGTKNAIEDPFSRAVGTALEDANNQFNSWTPPRKTFTIDVVYNDPGFQGTRTVYPTNNKRSLEKERIQVASEPLANEETNPSVSFFQTHDIGKSMRDVIDSMNASLTRSEHNFDLDSIITKAMKNVTVEVNVNNDMDGRQIASQISTIQGLKIKKQNS